MLKALNKAGSGHTAGSLGMADVFTALYFNVANFDPDNPAWDARDRIILSNAHICPVLYTAMAHAGFFPVSELMTLRKFGTRLHGHPHNESLPGLEASGGPLGQGVSIAAGKALAAKKKGQKHSIFALTSDGEVNEGQPWEAFMFAANYKLDNLIYILDRNFIQIDGNTEDVMRLDSLMDKMKAFGLEVFEVDGHDMQAIIDTLEKAKQVKGKPAFVNAITTPGKGVSFIENNHKWHGAVPNDDQLRKALEELEEERKRIEQE